MSSKRKAEVHPAAARLAAVAETAKKRRSPACTSQGDPVALVARAEAWRAQCRATRRAVRGRPGQGADRSGP